MSCLSSQAHHTLAKSAATANATIGGATAINKRTDTNTAPRANWATRAGRTAVLRVVARAIRVPDVVNCRSIHPAYEAPPQDQLKSS